MPNPSLLLAEDAPVLGEQVEPRFKMYSGALKAFEGSDGRKMLSCTASSSVEDLHGDTMTAACVQDMAPQAKRKSMVIFLNHSYDVPEDVFGYVTDSRIVSRATDTDGAAIYDLDLDIVLNEANDRAVQTYAAIKDQGVKLGVSIGALITDWKLKDEKAGWWGGLIIEGVNLLEASIVGIPANPRSWVQNAVKSLKSVLPTQKGETVVVGEAGPELVAKDCPDCGKPMADGHTCAAPESDVTADAAPDGETTESAADASTEKAEEPTDTVDLDAALEKATAALDGDSDAVVEFFRAAFISSMKRVEELETALAAAIADKEQAEANFQEAASVIELVAELPLGRKSTVDPQIVSFQDRFKGMYGEAWLKRLDSITD